MFGVPFFFFFFFFFNDTATTEIYTLSLHDALPISKSTPSRRGVSLTAWWATKPRRCSGRASKPVFRRAPCRPRSEEHTSELQSPPHLVCRLLLEKKKQKKDMSLKITNKTDSNHA